MGKVFTHCLNIMESLHNHPQVITVVVELKRGAADVWKVQRKDPLLDSRLATRFRENRSHVLDQGGGVEMDAGALQIRTLGGQCV